MKRTFRQAAGDAWSCLKEALALLRENAASAFALCALLYLLPALLSSISAWQVTAPLFAAWEDFLHGMMAGTVGAEELSELLILSMSGSTETLLRTGLLSLLSSFFLVPLLQASLARMNLAQLNARTRLSANDAASETLHSWKSLLFLAFISMAVARLLSLLWYIAATALQFVSGLLAMIPGLGGAALLGGALLALLVRAVFDFFVKLLLSFIWLAAVGEGTRGMAAVARSAQIFRRRIGVIALANLVVSAIGFALSALVSILWSVAFIRGGAPIRLMQLAEPILGAIFLPVTCALSAVLYVRAGGQGMGSSDPYGAPDHVHSIKSANIRDGQE